jgi:replicative DNA helicase
MTAITEAKQKIDLLQYAQQELGMKAKKVGSNKYRFNPCPVCGGNDHFTIHTDTNSFTSYSGCCTGGSIVDYLMQVEGFDKQEALRRIEQLAGVEKVASMPYLPKQKESLLAANKEATNEKLYLTDIIHELHGNYTDYYTKRGLTNKTISAYKLGYHEDGLNYVIEKARLKEKPSDIMKAYKYFLPVLDTDGGCSYFITRLDDNSGIKANKTHNLKGHSARIFNDRYILNPFLSDDIIFITEGIFDALSVEEIGFHAIALNSVTAARRLLEMIEQNKERLNGKIFVVALDNDGAGQKAKDEIIDNLKALKMPVTAFDVPANYKDLNEHLQCDRDSFAQVIQRFVSNIDKDTLLDAINKENFVISYLPDFLEQMKKNRANKVISTGFSTLDKKLGGGLYPGLYVLGAISSLGKTTFALQIGDTIAGSGEHVKLFSLEMSKFEIVAKSISRECFLIDAANAPSTRGVMMGQAQAELFAQAWESYKPTAANMAIYEGNFNTGVYQIREEVEKHIKQHNKKPVVVVDYLQVLAPVNERLSDKQAADRNIVELKRISRDYDVPVIAVSSFNRGNYATPVSFESFKESGSIEYTADTVIGLQLAGIKEVAEMKTETEKKQRLNELKVANPRQIELVILKNRNAACYDSQHFQFYPKNNYFIEGKGLL